MRNLINQSRRFNSSLGCPAVGMVQPSKFPCSRSQVPLLLEIEYHEQQIMSDCRKRLKAPPNHSGFNVAEEARIHKVGSNIDFHHFMETTQGLYESRPRLVKDQVEAVAKAKEHQRRLESQGQGLRQGSNSHQVIISSEDVYCMTEDKTQCQG